MSLTAAQVAARRNGIGASESVILFSEIPNEYSTRYQLWMEKTGKLDNTKQWEDDFQWWGHAMEPAIAQRYEYETGKKLYSDPTTLIHPKYPYILCHPDRYVVDDDALLVEIKTANMKGVEKWGEAGTDHVHTPYLFQCQHQMACKPSVMQVDLIAFFMNYRESRIYHIKRDNEFIAVLEDACTDFWMNHVMADVAPELTSLYDCKLHYKRERSTNFVQADEQILQTLHYMKAVKEQNKKGEILEEETAMQIRKFIGDFSGIVHNDRILCTLKSDARGVRKLLLRDI